MNQRRLLMLALAAGLAGQTAPLSAQTSSASLRRVGVLAPSTRVKEEVILKPFFEEMRVLGWIEGQTVVYDHVYADDQQQELTRLASELVPRKPALIFAPAQIAAVAARQATRTIPIVFGTGFDPVGTGLVASLARPGGNVTGVVNVIETLVPKRLELLREILPSARRVGFLRDPTELYLKASLDSIGAAATVLGLTLVWADMSSPS